MERLNNTIIKELGKKGVKVDAVYYCPHTPDEGCSCRKPETGMIEMAVRDLDIDVRKSAIIGDREDQEGKMAERFGMTFIPVDSKTKSVGTAVHHDKIRM